jgi:hypothetical protein
MHLHKMTKEGREVAIDTVLADGGGREPILI